MYICTQITIIKINNMKKLTAEKSYFKNNPKFGRSTKLINKENGIILIECLGILSKKELIKTYNYVSK